MRVSGARGQQVVGRDAPVVRVRCIFQARLEHAPEVDQLSPAREKTTQKKKGGSRTHSLTIVMGWALAGTCIQRTVFVSFRRRFEHASVSEQNKSQMTHKVLK